MGGVVSGTPPVPATSREMVSPCAAKLMFELTVADVVGLKRTVTAWVAPTPTRLNGLPETILKGGELDAAPETIPPTEFCTVKVCSAKPPGSQSRSSRCRSDSRQTRSARRRSPASEIGRAHV